MYFSNQDILETNTLIQELPLLIVDESFEGGEGEGGGEEDSTDTVDRLNLLNQLKDMSSGWLRSEQNLSSCF